MVRDFSHFSFYLNRLLKDVYAQPPDPLHTSWTEQVMDEWIKNLMDVHSVLDVGCGQAFAQPMFEKLGMQYTGVTLGEDYSEAKKLGRNVINCDYSFLPYEDGSFDLVFARHSLEYSPSPIPTLMEWRRVSKAFVCVVAPAPAHWGWTGANHYSLANKEQLQFWITQAGMGLVWEKDNIWDGKLIEHWVMAQNNFLLLTFYRHINLLNL